MRINKIHREGRHSNLREDRAILRGIEGIREQRRSRKPEKKKGKKGAEKGGKVEKPAKGSG